MGPKRTTYQGIDGLFIREFSNGYAVYNWSGSEQEITFQGDYQSISQDHTGDTHLVADRDGEIFLR